MREEQEEERQLMKEEDGYRSLVLKGPSEMWLLCGTLNQECIKGRYGTEKLGTFSIYI